MQLTLRNPCYNSTFYHIIPVETPIESDYKLFDKLRVIRLRQFNVLIFPEQEVSLCGPISYTAKVNEELIDEMTWPIAFDRDSMRLYLYSNRRFDVGVKNLTISAKLDSYQDVTSYEVFTTFAIQDNPCAFVQLTLEPSPFTNVTHFLGQESQSQ